MLIAKYRSARNPGKSAYVTAKVACEHGPGPGEFRCPSCNEVVFPVNPVKLSDEKYYRGPHFRHKKAALCNVQDCDQRVDASSTALSVTQRLRTPLFIRQAGKGEFILAAGFSSADKAMLHRLSGSAIKGITVKVPNAAKPLSITIEDMLDNGELTFIELPSPVARRSNWEVSLETTYEQTKSTKDMSVNEWSDRLDWFGDAANGAVFEYAAGNSGEKIRFGGCVKGGRAYLVAEKKVEQFKTPMQRFVERGILRSYQKLGTLQFRSGDRTVYTVAKVVFPNSNDHTGGDFEAGYIDLASMLDDRFGVSLSDTVQETCPLWPPAARMSDSYIIARMSEGNQVHALVSGLEPSDKVYLHGAAREPVQAAEVQRLPNENGESCDSAIITFPVVYSRSYATVNEYLPNTLDSFRFGVLKNWLAPQLILTGPNGEEVPFNSSITHTIEWGNGVSIKSVSTDCTVYRNGKATELQAGKSLQLHDPQEEFFARLHTGVILHFNPQVAIEPDADEWDELPDIRSRKNKYLRASKYQKYGKYRS